MSSSREVSILFIDDSKQLEVLVEDLKQRLEGEALEAHVETAKTLDGALELLRQTSFDVAVVDLLLDREFEGNSIIKRVLETTILPIIVFSGYPHDLAEDYENHGLIFKAPTKKISYVSEKISEWAQQGVLDFFSEHGSIVRSWRHSLQRTMWDHVSRYWAFIKDSDRNVLPQIAGRLASTLFHDFLSADSDGKNASEVPIHPGEVFVFETPRRYLGVGDLIRVEKDLFAVLTPACDLIPHSEKGAKAEHVLVAHCESLRAFLGRNATADALFKTILNPSPNVKKREEAQDKIEKMMRHSHLNEDGRLFFLPPFGPFEGGVIDFLKLKLFPYTGTSMADLVAQRTLSLNREISSELATRFGRYMIRLGQPAYYSEALFSAIREFLNTTQIDNELTTTSS